MASPDVYLLKGPMPPLPHCKEWDTTTCKECKRDKCLNTKLKLMEELVQECQMWRNVWGWVPSEVKYYAARVGQQIGIVQINFQRKIGILLDTKWDLIALELGIYDKEYDTVTGEYFYERKITQIKAAGIRQIDWIKERKPEKEILPTEEEPQSEEPQPDIQQ